MNYKTYALKSGVVINDAWLTQLSSSPDKVTSAAESYQRVPLVFKALRLRCNALNRVPFKFFRGEQEIEEGGWPYQDIIPFDKAIWQTEAGLLWSGAAYWLKLRNRFRYDKGVQILNPATITVKYNQTSGVFTFEQMVDGKSVGTWTDDELHYWREYNPLDEIQPGVSAAANALGNSQIMHYLSRFAGTFFESGAMPILALGLPENTAPAEVERVESWFKRIAAGVRNAWRPLGVRGEIKPTVITPSFKDMALPDVRSQAIESVADSFEIPETILRGNSASYATATQDWFNFAQTTIGPRSKFFEYNINQFLSEQKSTQGLRVEFYPNELPEMQEDEEQRASAFSMYVNGGMPKDVAAAVLGVNIPDDVRASWDASIAAGQEARDRMMDAPPKDDEDEDETAMEVRAELGRWKRKVIRLLHAGKSFAVSFESDVIPDGIKASVLQELHLAKSLDDVNGIFREARVKWNTICS